MYNALNGSAAAIRKINDGQVARQFSKFAQLLVKSPEKSYTCRFMDEAPLGAAGWLTSDIINKKEFKEIRFIDYSKKDADALIYDVNANRDVGSGMAKEKTFYFGNTAFYMVYDLRGWHIFVLCGERELEKKRINGGNLGALEMYFAPTPKHSYTQWIIRQDTGEIDFYNWNSPGKSFRLPEKYAKTETVYYRDKIATYIFFPWELVYDKLPFDSEEKWIFEMIRWSPAGGISWSGGTVHNTGKWGEIKWQAPSEKQLIKIKKSLLIKAWAKYKKTCKGIVDGFWAHKDLGDKDFLNEALLPEVNRLNKAGEKISKIDKLSNNEINFLFEKTIKDLYEFKYRVSEIRRIYLEKYLVAGE
jgi:hypothetical protein